MELLPNEQIIKESTDKEFALTNFRVNFSYIWWFKKYENTIFLEDISSIERMDKGNLWFLLLGVLFAFGGVIMTFGGIASGDFEILGPIALVVGIFLIIIWWSTNKTGIQITPNGGKDIFIVTSRKESITKDLLFNIQMAKINRIQQLYNSKF